VSPHSLVDCIVKHNQLGLARVEDLRPTAKPPVICLAPFVEGAEAQEFSLQAVLDAFDRHALVEGRRTREAGAECACTIEFLLDPNPNTTPWVYAVLHDDGLREDVSERELEPLADPPASSVQELFGRLGFQSLKFFRAQDELIAAFEQLEIDSHELVDRARPSRRSSTHYGPRTFFAKRRIQGARHFA
jgi:hypothetical protein